MAEIKIEKKKSIWPWILLVLIALGLIWYFFIRNQNNKFAEKNRVTEEVVIEDNVIEPSSNAISLYSAYLNDTSKMDIDHEYSQGALYHLIDAVQEKADMLNVDIKANLDEARIKASEITKNPNDVNHADLIKSSDKIITQALTTIQKEKFPNLAPDVAKLNTAVSEIDTSVKTLDQKEKVNNFFKSAESLLLKMQ